MLIWLLLKFDLYALSVSEKAIMIGIRRVYKSVALIGCADESVAVILRRALNSEAKYQVGSGSSGGGQDQKVEASDNARKEGSKFFFPRDPYAAEIYGFAMAQKLKEMEDAMPKLTPAERKLGLGPCEVCGKEKDHTTEECPYLEIIPKGEEGNLLEKYAVVCKGCGLEGGHPGKGWTGCAAIKYCRRCFVVGDHMYTNCPNVEPEKRERLRQRKRERCLLVCN